MLIDEKQGQISSSDIHRKLIRQIRAKRSKWASKSRIGQQELYEVAEIVLAQLISIREKSGFLTRISEKGAPDYYHSMYGNHTSSHAN